MSYQQMVHCDGEWYYFHENTGVPEPTANFYRIAVWAMCDDGSVIGLLGETTASTDSGVARLVTPPPLKGMYAPASALSSAALKSARGEAKPVLYSEVLNGPPRANNS